MNITLTVQVTGVEEEKLEAFRPLFEEELRGVIEGNYTITDSDFTEETAEVSVAAG